MLYFVFGFAVMGLLGLPMVPYRGAVARVTESLVLFFALVALAFLLFSSVDAMRVCCVFIHKISTQERLEWHRRARNLHRVAGLPAELGSELLRMDLIVERTAVVGRMLVYPFLVLFLILLARNPFFDGWRWPLSLVIVVSAISLHAIVAAALLRSEAARSRGRILERSRYRLLQAACGAPGSPTAEQVREVIGIISSERRGAFLPLLRHPISQAAWLPSGGAGALALMEFFVRQG